MKKTLFLTLAAASALSCSSLDPRAVPGGAMQSYVIEKQKFLDTNSYQNVSYRMIERGDMDSNGVFDARDVAAMEALQGKSAYENPLADINQDRFIDMVDLELLKTRVDTKYEIISARDYWRIPRPKTGVTSFPVGDTKPMYPKK